MGLLVIYGGRDDEYIIISIIIIISQINVKGFLNDLSILNVHTLSWTNVKILGIQKPPRCGHIALCKESKMIIYGGYNCDGFIGSELDIMELGILYIN